MSWLDDMYKEAKKQQEPHVFMRMTELQYNRWKRKRPTYVVGADEVGYGAIAGPLYVCAVVALHNWSISGLKDSKALCTKKGAIEEVAVKLYREARAGRISYQLATVDPARIDTLGPLTAVRKATCAALDAVTKDLQGSCLRVVDGTMLMPSDELSIPKADTFIPQVMAAAVLAKQARDSFMKDMHEDYPDYGFITNVGYISDKHVAALKRLGRCPLHRKSYKLKALGEKDDSRETTRTVGKGSREPTQGQPASE